MLSNGTQQVCDLGLNVSNEWRHRMLVLNAQDHRRDMVTSCLTCAYHEDRMPWPWPLNNLLFRISEVPIPSAYIHDASIFYPSRRTRQVIDGVNPFSTTVAIANDVPSLLYYAAIAALRSPLPSLPARLSSG